MTAFSASDAALEGFQVLRRHWRVVLGWCLFAVLAFVGLFWAYRREKRLFGMSREQRDALQRTSRRSADADYEDAVLDRDLRDPAQRGDRARPAERHAPQERRRVS